MSALRDHLIGLLADRRSEEARAFFQWLLQYVDRRVSLVGRRFVPDLLLRSDLEEVVSEVVTTLIDGGLARFRGETMPELVGYVRTIADRSVGHRARRRINERAALIDGGAEAARDWCVRLADPEQAARLVPDCPLTEDDERYLFELLRAGSKVELARSQGVSRAAVTQRVRRIEARIAALAPRDRAAARAWLEHAARQVLEEEPPVAR